MATKKPSRTHYVHLDRPKPTPKAKAKAKAKPTPKAKPKAKPAPKAKATKTHKPYEGLTQELSKRGGVVGKILTPRTTLINMTLGKKKKPKQKKK